MASARYFPRSHASPRFADDVRFSGLAVLGVLAGVPTTEKTATCALECLRYCR